MPLDGARTKTALVLAGGGSFGAIQVGMLHSQVTHGVCADCSEGGGAKTQTPGGCGATPYWVVTGPSRPSPKRLAMMSLAAAAPMGNNLRSAETRHDCRVVSSYRWHRSSWHCRRAA